MTYNIRITATIFIAAVFAGALFAAPVFVHASLYCPTLSHDLERGSTDAETDGQVSELQRFLSEYYGIPQLIEGVFGPKTQKYVQQFQKEQTLRTGGFVGQLTRAAIARVCAADVPAQVVGSSAESSPNMNNSAALSAASPKRVQIFSFQGPTTLYVDQIGAWILDIVNANKLKVDWKNGTSEKDEDKFDGSDDIFSSNPMMLTHKYKTPGTYTILLTSDGKKSTASSTAVVTVKPKPDTETPLIETFIGPTTLRVGRTGTWFVAMVGAKSFSVDWKDDSSKQGKQDEKSGTFDGKDISRTGTTTLTHIYKKPGTYEILLTAFSKKGTASSTVSATVVVNERPESGVPVIDSLKGPTRLRVGQTGTWILDMINVKKLVVDWNSGTSKKNSGEKFEGEDISPSDLMVLTHIYKKPGSYVILLTAEGKKGKATTSVTVEVSDSSQSASVFSSVQAQIQDFFQLLTRFFGDK